MSVKPELTLTCLKESRRYQFAQCPIGTFIVRLYWADYSKYVPSQRKLDGVYLLKDSKTNFHRVCEFAITSLESLEYLVANCNPATGTKENWFRSVTKQALWKFRQFAKAGYQFIKPIKVAVQAAVTQVKSVASNAVQSAKEAIKKVFRRAPRDWNDCKSAEDVQFIFDRTPAKFRTDKFVANYLSAYDKFVPSVKSYPVLPNPWDMLPLVNRPQLFLPAPKEALADAPQYGLSIDDIAPTYYVPEEGKATPQNTDIVDSPIEESEYRKLLKPVLDFKKPHAFLKEIGFKTGTVIGGYPRASKDLFEKVVKNCWKNQVALSQLRDIIAVG